MFAKLKDVIGDKSPPEVEAAIKLMHIVLNDEQYNKLVADELSASRNYKARKVLLESGHFLGVDLVQLVHACGDRSGTNCQVVKSVLDQLVEWALVADDSIIEPNGYTRYKWNNNLISLYVRANCLDNIMLGPSYVVNKYMQSVPPVFVTKGCDEYTGTAFLATDDFDAPRYVMVTAKHNVDPSDGITFNGFGGPQNGAYTALESKWILHPQLDLALLPVSTNGNLVPIFPIGTPRVLSRTITLGYPRIATTDGPYILAHGGELNAVVTAYSGEQHLIISNVVAPGNSGGPVLNEAGLCVGMVVKALETGHEGGISTANAAIPAAAILDFIAPHLRS